MGKGRACVRFLCLSRHASLPSSRNAACLFGPENRRGSLQNTKPPQAIQPMARAFVMRAVSNRHAMASSPFVDATRPPTRPRPRGGGSGRSVGRSYHANFHQQPLGLAQGATANSPPLRLWCICSVLFRANAIAIRLECRRKGCIVCFRPAVEFCFLLETFVESGSGRRLSLLDKNGTYDTYGKSQTAKIGTERKIHPLTTMPSPDGKRLIPGLCPK